MTAATSCKRIRILCFFSDLKNVTFYVFLNDVSKSLKKSLAGSKYRVGTLGSVKMNNKY